MHKTTPQKIRVTCACALLCFVLGTRSSSAFPSLQLSIKFHVDVSQTDVHADWSPELNHFEIHFHCTFCNILLQLLISTQGVVGASIHLEPPDNLHTTRRREQINLLSICQSLFLSSSPPSSTGLLSPRSSRPYRQLLLSFLSTHKCNIARATSHNVSSLPKIHWLLIVLVRGTVPYQCNTQSITAVYQGFQLGFKLVLAQLTHELRLVCSSSVNFSACYGRLFPLIERVTNAQSH